MHTISQTYSAAAESAFDGGRARRFRPVAFMLVSLAFSPLAMAGDADVFEPLVPEPTDDEWEFSILAYGWIPWMEIETAGGTDIEIGGDDVLKNLKMTALFELEARKGRWGVATDVIYLDLGFDVDKPLLGDLNQEAWIVTPKVTYRAWESEQGFLDVQAALRYYWLKVELEGQGPLGESGSADIWDGVVGLRAHFNLAERWYLPLLVDVGGGDSDFLAQLYAGVGYRFEHLDVALAFRVMYYDFADGAPLDDQLVYGPIISAKFTF